MIDELRGKILTQQQILELIYTPTVTVTDKLTELAKVVSFYNHMYHDVDVSVVPDDDYDMLFNTLIKYAKYSKQMGIAIPIAAAELLNKVGGKAGTIKHSRKMYSLSNCFNKDELTSYLVGYDYVRLTYEHKLDGLAISLHYDGGLLQLALTRGDGEYGEDVTLTCMSLPSVPTSIKYTGKLELRGECIIDNDSFARINAGAKTPYSNSRNLVSGLFRKTDHTEAAKANVQFICYNVEYIENNNTDSATQLLQYVETLGFTATKPMSIEMPVMDEHIVAWAKLREELPYMIDGIVLKIDSRSMREQAGYLERIPKWATAYKFPSKQVKTRLWNVTWQVGTTGVITPVAKIIGVEIGGVTINNVTLHNYGEMKRLGIKPDCIVSVIRSGDVIPKIIAAEGGEGEYFAPDKCPGCGGPTVINISSPIIKCANPEMCDAKLISMMQRFVSRDGLDVDGIAEKTIELLYTLDSEIQTDANHAYILETPTDIFDIDLVTQVLVSKNYMSENVANSNIVKVLTESKAKLPTIPLHKVLYAMTIPNIGHKDSKTLASHLGKLSNLLTVNKEQLIRLPDYGPVCVNSIVDYVRREPALIAKMIALTNDATCVVEDEPNVLSKKLNDVFCITGTFTDSRKNLAELIKQHGGYVTDGINAKTSALLVGEKPSSKLATAIKKNLKIITEADLYNIIRGE